MGRIRTFLSANTIQLSIGQRHRMPWIALQVLGTDLDAGQIYIADQQRLARGQTGQSAAGARAGKK